MYLSRSLSLSFYAFICLLQMVRCVFGALLAPPKKENFFLFFLLFLQVENRETQRSIDRIDRHATFSHVRLVGVRKTAHRSFSSSVVEQKSRSFFFREERTRKRRERTHIQKQLLSCSAFPSSLLVRYAREREREREKNTRGRPQSKRILFKRR